MSFGPEMTILGFLVGILVGLTGVGGAALITPIMVLMGINPSIAVGTDLFYNSITKLFGTVQHYRQRTINIKLVLSLAAGSLPGAVVAIGILKSFDTFFANQETLIKLALAFMLMTVATVTLMRQLFDRRFQENRWQKRPLSQKRILMVGIGFALGAVVGLTSIGSGSLFALALLCFFRLRAAEVVGTDIAHAFLLVSVASLFHAGLGHVDFGLAFKLLLGSVPGVIIGSTFSAKVPTKPLRTMMAMLILISGIMLI